MIARRSLITGLVALVAAPAIVKIASLMPVNMASITVWASNQSGYGLTVNPLSMRMNKGDIITIDDVFMWYRGDNTPTRRLRQFVVTVGAEPEHRIIHLYPPIIGEHDPRYRTVVDLPMNGATVKRIEPLPQHSAV